MIRQGELRESCSVLGVSSDSIKIVSKKEMRDGMEENWDLEAVETEVDEFVTASSISTVSI